MLSRKVIILEGKGNISYNYHYELMKRLYQALTLSDNIAAIKLHDQGVSIDNKKFKLFNFCLNFNKSVEYNKDFVSINNNRIKLIISGKNDTLNSIIKGLVKNGGITLSGAYLKIVDCEQDSKFTFKNTMLYKVRTPIVESVYQDGVKYLNPYQEEYYKALYQNLLRKYKAVYNKDYEGQIFFDVEDVLKVKKKCITGIKEKGFLIGYTDFEIFIEAKPDMQKIAYYLGLGQNSSIGMGSLSYITGGSFNG